ncbi:hypothetical protein L6452_32469 [Arctium lappa]|uniref:Uncharacterized protein n=1 Tax=Arctium lappa TaxID=4217 RepID=A0ACB8Z517_ARCLA|nr:hypothetical protein L6452_32469 [Arctium lappa]
MEVASLALLPFFFFIISSLLFVTYLLWLSEPEETGVCPLRFGFASAFFESVHLVSIKQAQDKVLLKGCQLDNPSWLHGCKALEAFMIINKTL